jgi:hypothetical protein
MYLDFKELIGMGYHRVKRVGVMSGIKGKKGVHWLGEINGIEGMQTLHL